MITTEQLENYEKLFNDKIGAFGINREVYEDGLEQIAGIFPQLIQEIKRLRIIVEEAKEQEAWLTALESAGVDNWSGIDFAREIYENELK